MYVQVVKCGVIKSVFLRYSKMDPFIGETYELRRYLLIIKACKYRKTTEISLHLGICMYVLVIRQ